MSQTKTIELNDLLTMPTVTLGGKPIRVKPVNGRTYQQLRSLTLSDDLIVVYEYAKACLPDLSEEEVYDLTPTQIKAVLSVASEKLSEVEALFPNLTAPTETTDQPSA
jgi:hypothetical protein